MSLVGKPVERIEDLRLLRGRGQYVDDLHREGMLHAALLRSPVAHGRLVGVEVSKAKTMPGVRAVFTAADLQPVPKIPLRLAPLPELEKFEQPVIAQREVRYVGEPIALVVADTLAQAEDALEAIDLEIEPLAAVARREQGELAIKYTAAKGDAVSVKAPYTRRERFSVQRHTAVCMEPRGLLAHWDGAKTKLTVAGAAKVPFATRRMLAKNMDLPE
ncbi:MAG TPA: molybdopterin cofactor-binding domain-containing protein, partial [Burkholderiales bacterium]|nr:molybdopterin cofactor-binding domain-containing protein [Burkholderiales bacterium]